MINLLIADNNKEFCLKLFKIIKDDFSQVNIYIANDTEEVMCMIKRNKPKLIFWNLKMPDCDCQKIIESIKINNYYPTYILTLQNFSSLLPLLKNSKALYYINKELNFLETKEKIISIINLCLQDEKETLIVKEKKEYILNELKKLGFNFTNIGTKYLLDSILEIIKDKNKLKNLEKNVYNKIAKENNISVENVKWNIKSSINSMWKYGDENYILQYLKLNNGYKPTAKIIIEFFSEIEI